MATNLSYPPVTISSNTVPKILMLILASDTDPIYIEFQKIWCKYMNSNPNIDSYFYKADPTLKEEALLVDKNTLLVKCEESFNTCYEKTLKAFEYFSPQFSKYDYIIRPNLSSFIVFDHYLEFCKKVPKVNGCSAVIGIEKTIQYPSGSAFTITPDLVMRLLEERSPYVIQDDVSIGNALKTWNIPILPAPRTDILYDNDMQYIDSISSNDKNVFHYRVKRLSGNRNIDVDILNKLVDKYYTTV